MSKYTVLISRNFSAVIGKPNGRPLGRVIQLLLGDHVDEWNTKKAMKKIFYWRTVELSDSDSYEIKKALNSPEINLMTGIITYPKTHVDMDMFSTADKAKLSARGSIPEKLGGALNKLSFKMTIV